MRERHMRSESMLLATSMEIGSETSTSPKYSDARTALTTQHMNAGQCRLVMAIDDSPTVRKIVETCLRREGFEVESFPDGVEAIRWLARSDARIPALVILDIHLPKMDGYEVARRFKSDPRLKQTVVVMLSRRDGVIERLKGRLVGAKDYLVKPFKTQDILAVVEMYLGVPM
jgi:twitching motility two-component system response regulator PilG